MLRLLRKSQRPALLIIADGVIYVYNGWRPIRTRGGNGSVITIAEHDGQMYEACYGGVSCGRKILWQCPKASALCSHEGVLYLAANDPDREVYTIYDITGGTEVATRPGYIYALVVHEGRLYDGGDYGLRETVTGSSIFSGRGVTRLCSHKGKLYSLNYGIIRDAMTEKQVAFREETIIGGLCSFDGDLLDADGWGRIWKTLEGTILISNGEYKGARTSRPGVTALIPVSFNPY